MSASTYAYIFTSPMQTGIKKAYLGTQAQQRASVTLNWTVTLHLIDDSLERLSLDRLPGPWQEMC